MNYARFFLFFLFLNIYEPNCIYKLRVYTLIKVQLNLPLFFLITDLLVQ